MTTINEDFIRNKSSKIKMEDLIKVADKEGAIIKKTKGYLSDHLGKVILMLKLISDYIRGDYKEMPWGCVTAIAFALLYILNPFDIIPDVIPFIGYIDDVLVLTIVLDICQEGLLRYQKWKNMNEI